MTYVSNCGCSVIDYCVLSKYLISKCGELQLTPMTDSKHMPVELVFPLDKPLPTESNGFTSEKFIWNAKKKKKICIFRSADSDCIFNNNLGSIEVSMCFAAMSLVNVDAALDKFNEGLRLDGQCMKSM